MDNKRGLLCKARAAQCVVHQIFTFAWNPRGPRAGGQTKTRPDKPVKAFLHRMARGQAENLNVPNSG